MSSLDKLAQLPTHSVNQGVNDATLRKRARSKYYTNRIVAPLLYLDSPLHKQYERAYYCNSSIIQQGKKFTAKYCNSRVCHICNRIRTAKFINGYQKPLQELGNLEFITLTFPNVKADKLRQAIKEARKSFTNIIRVLRERRGVKISGICKVECTYNPDRNDFHPHLHIIADCNAGTTIVTEWMQRYPSASGKGQDVRKADKNSFLELFKYTTKIAAKAATGGGYDVHIPALNVIMVAMDRLRTFQPFGGIKKVSEDVQELQSVEIEAAPEQYTEWLYNYHTHDWNDIYNPDICLTRYKPPDLLLNIYY